MQRRFAEAEQAVLATLRLDPQNPLALDNLAHLQFRRGAVENAIGSYHRAIEKRDGDEAETDHDALCLGLALRAAGRTEEAVAVMRSAAAALRARSRKTPTSEDDEAILVALLAGGGRTAEARARLARLEKGPEPTGATAAWFARAHVALGELDRASALYVRAVDTGYSDPYYVLIDPSLAAIRDRPEIDGLLPPGSAPPA
jgi:tetratricopeptide (TPR) repeat protein